MPARVFEQQNMLGVVHSSPHRSQYPAGLRSKQIVVSRKAGNQGCHGLRDPLLVDMNAGQCHAQ